MSNLTVKIKPGNIKSSDNPVFCRIGKRINKVNGNILKKGIAGKRWKNVGLKLHFDIFSN
jgi:hypothetical protein